MCPLCLSQKTELFHQDKNRSFLKCLCCGLVFVPRSELVSLSEEKSRYDAHENSEDDLGYKNYLQTILHALRPHLKTADEGLDFGCGRTTLLSDLAQGEGFKVLSYDLFYHPEPEHFKRTYDFIILSEVIEHLRSPLETMLELRRLLRPGGRFFIKTKVYPEAPGHFAQWFYKRDITHVQFFTPSSFNELSQAMGLSPHEDLGSDLYLFRDN